MYARYIPPPKARPEPTADKEAKANGAPAPSRPQGTSSVTPYARYIPPVKQDKPVPSALQKGNKIVFNDDDAPPVDTRKRKLFDIGDDAKLEGRKDKKPKKEKKRKTEGDGTAEASKGAGMVAGEDSFSGQAETPGGGDKKATKAKKKQAKSRTDSELRESPKPAVNGAASAGNAEREKGKRTSKVGERNSDQVPAVLASNLSKPMAPKEVTLQADDAGREKNDTQKKKTKKKKRNRAGEEDEGHENPSEEKISIQERHKAVLRKKEKSLNANRLVDDQKDGQAGKNDGAVTQAESLREPEEVHGLVPLPQPDPVQIDSSRPTYETLPPWLASPIRVSQDATATFASLGIMADAAAVLEAKGYTEAFAVQTAAIPLLLPTPDRQGDLAISAATGSGKTLAYVLPMMQDLSQSLVTRLRALVVVPTRELVRQAQEACELCATAFATGSSKKINIGTSVGNQAFKQEQAVLMEETQRYDPAGYLKYLQKRARVDLDGDSESEGEMDIFQTATEPLPDHVVEHHPKVDVLICTPGRLVEHLRQTPGFNLDHVRWLIVDEADKLLGQSFQQWLDLVTEELGRNKLGARDFPGTNKSGVRKVVLSATMTRDLSLLNELKLRRPQLIVLEGTKEEEEDPDTRAGEHNLPDLLEESAVRVRDPNLKPLYLLELLNSGQLHSNEPHLADGKVPKKGIVNGQAEDEEDETRAQDDLDPDSASSSESESSDSEPETSVHPADPTDQISRRIPSVLIFTRSNESALRLSRLLAILSPALGPLVGTLTSTTRTAQRGKTLRAFTSQKLRILVASDLVSRGIDLPELENVVNYDMPTSVASYVHRVGRTARAGRGGHAWTLVAKSEAAWFWREIGDEGKGANGTVRRRGRIERARLFSTEDNENHFGEERTQEYEQALEQLGKEAADMRRKSKM